MWKNLSKYNDAGLLLLRLVVGGLYLWTEGWPKLAGGLAAWKRAGAAMKHVGITFLPTYWGTLFAFTASIGIVLFILGLAFRPACLLLFLMLTVGGIIAYRTQGLNDAAPAIYLATLFLALLFIGPGKFSLDKG